MSMEHVHWHLQHHHFSSGTTTSNSLDITTILESTDPTSPLPNRHLASPTKAVHESGSGSPRPWLVDSLGWVTLSCRVWVSRMIGPPVSMIIKYPSPLCFFLLSLSITLHHVHAMLPSSTSRDIIMSHLHIYHATSQYFSSFKWPLSPIFFVICMGLIWNPFTHTFHYPSPPSFHAHWVYRYDAPRPLLLLAPKAHSSGMETIVCPSVSKNVCYAFKDLKLMPPLHGCVFLHLSILCAYMMLTRWNASSMSLSTVIRYVHSMLTALALQELWVLLLTDGNPFVLAGCITYLVSPCKFVLLTPHHHPIWIVGPDLSTHILCVLSIGPYHH